MASVSQEAEGDVCANCESGADSAEMNPRSLDRSGKDE